MKIFKVPVFSLVFIFLSCGVSRSPLLDKEEISPPCKYMLEYWYSAQKKDKELSGILLDWCRKTDIHQKCLEQEAVDYQKCVNILD